jgi:hypothetical protein
MHTAKVNPMHSIPMMIFSSLHPRPDFELFAQGSMLGFPLLNKFLGKYFSINGSTYVRAYAHHRGCAHARAFLQRARVRVRAYSHYGNTFRLTSRFL